MKNKIINKIMYSISNNNSNLDKTKLEEIKYGLLGLYGLLSKTIVISIIALLLGIFKEYILFLLFYGILRSIGFGSHASSNIKCWIFTTLLLLGLPYIFTIIILTYNLRIILWIICFINYLIFSPADTDKRPIVSKKYKIKLKVIILIISVIYLILILKINYLSNIILASMLLEAFLTNPISYLIMGNKIRFKLNDIYLFKQKR